jgi:ABC-type multidrug transport system fused ATPase/permease subunit
MSKIIQYLNSIEDKIKLLDRLKQNLNDEKQFTKYQNFILKLNDSLDKLNNYFLRNIEKFKPEEAYLLKNKIDNLKEKLKEENKEIQNIFYLQKLNKEKSEKKQEQEIKIENTHYAKVFEDKLKELEGKTWIYKFKDENLRELVKQDLNNIVNELNLVNYKENLSKNLEILKGLRGNINIELKDFNIDKRQIRPFFRRLPFINGLIKLIFNIKKVWIQIATDIFLIILAIFSFIKILFDFLYSYRIFILFILAIFLVWLSLNSSFEPAWSFFSLFVWFDYFYSPLTYAIFKSFFLILFVFYLFYTFIDVVFELAFWFRKDISQKAKLLLSHLLLLVIFSSLILW